jgi:cytochrome b subunit of formate dehydrogenase
MTISEYYNVLGIRSGSTVEEIKKAYRKKAREFHPDISRLPDAKELFISATEAYEFLLSFHEKIVSDEEAYRQAMEDWRKYRQNRSQKRAKAYAQASFSHFKNTNFYKTTRIFDGTTIISCLIVSIMVLVVTVSGYIIRIRHPLPGIEKPTVIMLVIFLAFGMVLFVISFIYLKLYIQSSIKNKKQK